MIEVPAEEFSLQATLSSGQAFRWTTVTGPSTRAADDAMALAPRPAVSEHRDGRDSAASRHHGTQRHWYYGFLGQAVVKVCQESNALYYESSDPTLTPNRIRHYFGLDHNLSEILSSIDVDMQIHQAIVRFRGLRVLRQDGWETLASFICASFNNIKRIEGMIERLCQAYGDPIALNGFRGFSFPQPEMIANTSERRLRSLGLGYRAPYLRATARLVVDGKLPIEQLRQVDYETTKRALLGCDGVGDKVADCVALFGFEKYEAFPIDIWMERAMRYYFRHRRMTRKRLHEYAIRHFGQYAGYAQQYLYHYIRTLRSVADSAAG